MNFRNINVIIEPPHFFSWKKQSIQVDGSPMFEVRRSLRFFSIVNEVHDSHARKMVFRVIRPKLHKSEYKVETANVVYTLRRISYWQWECCSENDKLYINRLGGTKCVLSKQGRQMAIMSLNTNLPFVEDRNTYIRVNNEKYLYLSVAAALILKGSGINLNSLLPEQHKLSPIRSVKLAR